MFDNIQNRSLLIFGGKGGCGKTTSSCVTGYYLARLNPDKKVLIASCDPAHSVGDSLGISVGCDITPVEGMSNLWALEIDADKEFSEFKTKYEEVMKQIVDRGTYFDKEDIDGFFSLSMPGLDEMMAIIKISDILDEGRFDLIILDTAPTGHTIRLLGLPAQMKKWLNVMDLMQSKFRFIAKQFSRRYIKNDSDIFLDKMNKKLNKVNKLLINKETTAFIPVTKPEPLPIEETERLLQVLKKSKIFVKSIIVNQVKEGNTDCQFCSGKAELQEQELESIKQKFADYELAMIPIFPYQISGSKRLEEYGRILFKEQTYNSTTEKQPADTSPEDMSYEKLLSEPSVLMKDDVSLYIFGGKGGVGKTTLASASAIGLAKKYPSKKVLVFSTDPAHSLSDNFGIPIGNEPVVIEGCDNLSAMEIDAPKLLDEFKKKYIDDIKKAFNSFVNTGMNLKFDKEIFEELLELTPPGLDEIMALRRIMDFMDENRFDIYVLDSAATGHLLRFLKMPHLVKEWLVEIFKLMLKNKEIIRLASLQQELLALSKNTKKINEILTNSNKSRFVAVALPELMVKSELDDLLENLKLLDVTCGHILINMVRPETECSFCELKRKEQIRTIKKIVDERSSEYGVSQIMLLPDPVNGIKRLNEFSDEIYA
jgi:arsenite/tail-anchored protein-transporting ATPase